MNSNNYERVVNAKVEREQVNVLGYFNGSLPITYYKLEHTGWVRRLANPLPPSNTTMKHAERDASKSVGRLAMLSDRGSAQIVPHVKVSIHHSALGVGQTPVALCGYMSKKLGLDLSGLSGTVKPFEITYAETLKMHEQVFDALTAYFE